MHKGGHKTADFDHFSEEMKRSHITIEINRGGASVVDACICLLTQSLSSVYASAHAKHAVHTTLKTRESAGDDAEVLSPRGDIVVKRVVANGDVINTSINLEFPTCLFDLVSNSKKIFGSNILPPILFEDEFELAVRTHAAEAKS